MASYWRQWCTPGAVDSSLAISEFAVAVVGSWPLDVVVWAGVVSRDVVAGSAE